MIAFNHKRYEFLNNFDLPIHRRKQIYDTRQNQHKECLDVEAKP